MDENPYKSPVSSERRQSKPQRIRITVEMWFLLAVVGLIAFFALIVFWPVPFTPPRDCLAFRQKTKRHH